MPVHLSLVSIWSSGSSGSSGSSQSSQKKCSDDGTIIWKRYPDDRKRPGRFKIYTIVPIVRIELNSIQAIEVVSVVRVVCDRLGSVSIWSSRSSEHFFWDDWDDWDDPDDPDNHMETRLYSTVQVDFLWWVVTDRYFYTRISSLDTILGLPLNQFKVIFLCLLHNGRQFDTADKEKTHVINI